MSQKPACVVLAAFLVASCSAPTGSEELASSTGELVTTQITAEPALGAIASKRIALAPAFRSSVPSDAFDARLNRATTTASTAVITSVATDLSAPRPVYWVEVVNASTAVEIVEASVTATDLGVPTADQVRLHAYAARQDDVTTNNCNPLLTTIDSGVTSLRISIEPQTSAWVLVDDALARTGTVDFHVTTVAVAPAALAWSMNGSVHAAFSGPVAQLTTVKCEAVNLGGGSFRGTVTRTFQPRTMTITNTSSHAVVFEGTALPLTGIGPNEGRVDLAVTGLSVASHFAGFTVDGGFSAASGSTFAVEGGTSLTLKMTPRMQGAWDISLHAVDTE